MKLLIDECVDERLRLLFPGHEYQTARFANLAGLKILCFQSWSKTAQRHPPGREWLRVRLEPARNDCHAVNRTWDNARNARVGQVAIPVHIEDRQMRGPSEAAGAINCRDQT
jgi:hypothetical protein